MGFTSRVSNGKGLIWGSILFIVAAITSLVIGIMGFTGEKKSLDEAFVSGLGGGEIVSGVPAYGSSSYALKVKHTVKSIPVGNDYYFYICSEDEDSLLAVRAPKDFGKNFDEEFRNYKNIRIKGKVRRMSYETRTSLNSDEIVVGDRYIDLLSTRMSILWIITGVLGVVCIVLFILANRSRQYDDSYSEASGSKVMNAVLAGGFIAFCFLFIYVLAHT